MGAIESSRHHTVDLLSVSVFLLVRRRRWRKNFVSTSNQTHLELDPPPGHEILRQILMATRSAFSWNHWHTLHGRVWRAGVTRCVFARLGGRARLSRSGIGIAIRTRPRENPRSSKDARSDWTLRTGLLAVLLGSY